MTRESDTSQPRILSADPGRQFDSDRHLVEPAIRAVLESGTYVLGLACDDFEAAFGRLLGNRSCVGVASGTDALELSLRLSGISDGDEVILPALAPSACASAVCRTGAIPVFADVDPVYLTLDASSVEASLTERTRAMFAVHLYGHPCDMGRLTAAVQERGVRVIEDGSQAHGAEWGGSPVGTLGDLAAFSFYPTKNLAAVGDGGALICGAHTLERARKLRQYGWEDRHVSAEFGMNTRLDELQAAVLTQRLATLKARNDRRRHIAWTYTDAFSQTEMTLPAEHELAHSVYHQYVLRCDRRDSLRQFLAEQGIDTSVLYPVPLHQQPAFQDFPRSTSLEQSERATSELLCLPIYPDLTDSEVGRVIEAVLSFPVG